MTERLYYDQSYLREFDAVVTAARDGSWVALDRSAFYPTSGGQPYDTGKINWDGGTAAVTDVEADASGVVWHRVSALPPLGNPVHGAIDWERRWDHMQQHAGDHMLAGAAWQLLGGVTIGLHLGEETSTIDLDMPDGRTHLTAEEEKLLEDTVNRRVQQDDPIRCWFPAPAELALLPLRKQPTVADHVRIVAMGDYEMVPCGGTHPATTGQIGPVKILSTAPARGKMRLCFVAGMRAVRCFQRAMSCADQVSAALSADWMGDAGCADLGKGAFRRGAQGTGPAADAGRPGGDPLGTPGQRVRIPPGLRGSGYPAQGRVGIDQGSRGRGAFVLPPGCGPGAGVRSGRGRACGYGVSPSRCRGPGRRQAGYGPGQRRR